jgi:hypothetical protein
MAVITPRKERPKRRALRGGRRRAKGGRLPRKSTRRRKQLKNSPQIRTLFLFRSRFIQKRKTSRRAAKKEEGVK